MQDIIEYHITSHSCICLKSYGVVLPYKYLFYISVTGIIISIVVIIQ